MVMALNTIQDLGQLNAALSQVNSLAESRFGGRKFNVAGEKVSLNDIVKKIEELKSDMVYDDSENEPLRNAVAHVQTLNEMKNKKILTKLRQFCGNLLFNRDKRLATILGNTNIHPFELKYYSDFRKINSNLYSIDSYIELYAKISIDKNELQNFRVYMMKLFNEEYNNRISKNEKIEEMSDLVRIIRKFIAITGTQDDNSIKSLKNEHLRQELAPSLVNYLLR